MTEYINTSESSAQWFELKDEDALSEGLTRVFQAKFHSKDYVWAYHPQSNALGKVIAELVLARLLNADIELRRLHQEGRLMAKFDHKVIAGRRDRKVDLCLAYRDEDDPPQPRLILEVKACMTEHQKARPRLRSELFQTLDIAKQLQPPVITVGVLVFNLATSFLSPLNQPGHNKHIYSKCLETLERLVFELGIGQPDGYDKLLVVPIDFDNDVKAEAVIGKNRPKSIALPSRPLDLVARQLVQFVSENPTGNSKTG